MEQPDTFPIPDHLLPLFKQLHSEWMMPTIDWYLRACKERGLDPRNDASLKLHRGEDGVYWRIVVKVKHNPLD